jgi:hypothetical protein
MKVPYFKKPKGKTMDELVAQSRGNYWGCEHEVALVRITSFGMRMINFVEGFSLSFRGTVFSATKTLFKLILMNLFKRASTVRANVSEIRRSIKEP